MICEIERGILKKRRSNCKIVFVNHANTFWQIICLQPVSMNLSSHNYAGHPRIFNAGYLTGYRTVVGGPVNTVMYEII